MGAGGMVLVHACWLPDAPMARALDFQLLPDVPRASKVVVEGMCGLGQSLCIPEVQEQTYKDKQCRNCGTALQSGDFLNKEAHTSYFHPCMYLADYAIAQLGAVSCSLDLQRLHEALWWVLGA
eukprot:scaffold128477_cov15-Tisochrysis_lutea.AAC.1